MKTFVKENWYKLMVGTSMMMASFGFMIYAVSPAYSNSELEKTEMNNEDKLNTPVGTNGVIVGSTAYFIDGGYVYSISTEYIAQFAGYDGGAKFLSSGFLKWVGSDFISYMGHSPSIIGKKTKLP